MNSLYYLVEKQEDEKIEQLMKDLKIEDKI